MFFQSWHNTIKMSNSHQNVGYPFSNPRLWTGTRLWHSRNWPRKRAKPHPCMLRMQTAHKTMPPLVCGKISLHGIDPWHPKGWGRHLATIFSTFLLKMHNAKCFIRYDHHFIWGWGICSAFLLKNRVQIVAQSLFTGSSSFVSQLENICVFFMSWNWVRHFILC